jgi:hypothetical protein
VYYNTLPPAEKARVDAIGGPSPVWLQNAVNAGVPDAIMAVGGTMGAAEPGWEDPGGAVLPWQDAAEPSEWLGVRKPTPSELRKWAVGRSEDFARFSDRVLAKWLAEGDWNIQTGGFTNKYGDPVGKPIDSGPNTPKGVDGLGQPITGGGAPGGGYGGTGGYGGGGRGGGGGGIFGGLPAELQPQNWGLTDEEKGYLEAITGLAESLRGQSEQLFGAGFPAYQQSLDYWSKLMGTQGRGGIDAALGPVREQISEGYTGAEASLRGLRGAELASAKAELARGKAGDLGRLPAELQPTAAMGLQQAAEFGVTTGLGAQVEAGGLYQGAQQATAQSRLAEEGLATQIGVAGLQAKTALGVAQIQARSMWDVAALGAEVDRESIAAQQSLASQELAARAFEFEALYAQRNYQLEQQLWMFNQEMQQRSKEQRSSLIGSIFGTLGSIAVGALFASDVGFKQDIAPGRRGLSDVVKLKTYNYTYIDDEDKDTQQGILAQDLEKIAPEFVVETPRGKMVNSYGLLAMTVEAVKELDDKKADRAPLFAGGR